jgi:Winged helix-turn helix
LRNSGKIEERMWKVGERKEEVPTPITLPSLDEQLQAGLHQRYEEARDAQTRTRYQMILLARLGYMAPHIARMVLRSEDTVARVLNRFLAGGLDAVPRRSAPGRARTITSARARRVVACD